MENKGLIKMENKGLIKMENKGLIKMENYKEMSNGILLAEFVDVSISVLSARQNGIVSELAEKEKILLDEILKRMNSKSELKK